MRVIATPVKARDLKPGDLFSTANQRYFDRALRQGHSHGERVYVRTNTQCTERQLDDDVYRITIER